MRQEALEAYRRHCDQFQSVLSDVLDGEPDGLTSVQILKRLHQHPGFDPTLPIYYMSFWFSEASDDVVVHDWEAGRYLHPKYADKDLEAYRPTIAIPDYDSEGE